MRLHYAAVLPCTPMYPALLWQGRQGPAHAVDPTTWRPGAADTNTAGMVLQGRDLLRAAPAALALRPAMLRYKASLLAAAAASHPRWAVWWATASPTSVAVAVTYSRQRLLRLDYVRALGAQGSGACIQVGGTAVVCIRCENSSTTQSLCMAGRPTSVMLPPGMGNSRLF